MSVSLKQIFIHATWSTKGKSQLITPEIENAVYNYMYAEFKSSGCIASIINGMPDHVHCLFLLNPGRALEEVIKNVKGSTSHWINHEDLIVGKFAWQKGFEAHSISESDQDRVYYYIKNQKNHHGGKDEV